MKTLLTLLAIGCLALGSYKIYHDFHQSTGPSAIAASRVIEPRYRELFSDLNSDRPADLVPLLEITRERILDKNVRAPKEKQIVYETAATLLTGMIDLAEERTRALQGILQSTSRANHL